MTWTFKDRFNSNNLVIIDDDFPQLLKRLEGTFFDFRTYASLDTTAQNKLIKHEGIIFAKTIYIHTQISYCLGTHDCKEDFYYEFYCNTVKKHFTEIHPMFAMKKYAEFIAFINGENEATGMRTMLNENINNLNNDT